MATDVVIANLKVKTDVDTSTVNRSLDDARRAIEATKAKVDALDAAFVKGQVTIDRYRELGQALAFEQQRLAGALQAAEQAQARLLVVEDRAVAGKEKTGKAAQRAAMGVLSFSQLIEDAQYGLRAVVNNIPPVLMGFGAGPGLAGVVSLAAVAVNVLINNWDKLTDLFSRGSTAQEALSMEELAKKTKLTADEQERFNKLRERSNEIAALGALKSEKEQRTEKRFKAVMGEADYNKVASGLAALRLTRMGGRTGVMRAEGMEENVYAWSNFWKNAGDQLKLQAAWATGGEKGVQERFMKMRDEEFARRHGMVTGRAAEDVQAAMKDQAALSRVIKEIESAPGAFPASTARELRGLLPGGVTTMEREGYTRKAAGQLVSEGVLTKTQEMQAYVAEEGPMVNLTAKQLEELNKRTDKIIDLNQKMLDAAENRNRPPLVEPAPVPRR